jgi:hypothetical protein
MQLYVLPMKNFDEEDCWKMVKKRASGMLWALSFKVLTVEMPCCHSINFWQRLG